MDPNEQNRSGPGIPKENTSECGDETPDRQFNRNTMQRSARHSVIQLIRSQNALTEMLDDPNEQNIPSGTPEFSLKQHIQ